MDPKIVACFMEPTVFVYQYILIGLCFIQKVYLVVGGFTEHGSGRLDTTETFLEGHHHWRQVE